MCNTPSGDKVCSPASVPQPFRGDYVSLHQNEKWKKVMGDTPDFTFADIIMKVNRKNGKVP